MCFHDNVLLMCCHYSTYSTNTVCVTTSHHGTSSVQTGLPLHLVRLQGNGALQHEDQKFKVDAVSLFSTASEFESKLSRLLKMASGPDKPLQSFKML